MGHILQRKRSDGSTAFTAQIRKKEQGVTVYNITQTFNDRAKAKAWMSKVETDLKSGTRLPQLKEEKKTLLMVIDQYIEDLGDDIGKTKRQVLRTIKSMSIAQQVCDDIDASALVAFARVLKESRKPQTVGNYMMHLSAVFSIAEIAFQAKLDEGEMRKALKTCRRLKIIKKSGKRNRPPVSGKLSAALLFLYLSGGRDRTMTWDIHQNENRLC
jgi:hypothetical protein